MWFSTSGSEYVLGEALMRLSTSGSDMDRLAILNVVSVALKAKDKLSRTNDGPSGSDSFRNRANDAGTALVHLVLSLPGICGHDTGNAVIGREQSTGLALHKYVNDLWKMDYSMNVPLIQAVTREKCLLPGSWQTPVTEGDSIETIGGQQLGKRARRVTGTETSFVPV